MSSENVNKSSIVTVNNVTKRTVTTSNRVNIDILKNRIYKQERKEVSNKNYTFSFLWNTLFSRICNKFIKIYFFSIFQRPLEDKK